MSGLLVPAFVLNCATGRDPRSGTTYPAARIYWKFPSLR